MRFALIVFVGILIAVAAYADEPAPAADDTAAAPVDSSGTNVFRSAIAGIEIRKPDSWYFANLQDVMDRRTEVKLKDEDMQRAMAALASAPLVVATRHPEPYERLNPSFQVIVRPVAQLEGQPPVAILRKVEPTLNNMFADYRTVAEPKAVDVGGAPAARLTAAYTVTAPDGTVFPTQATIVMIVRDKLIYQIGFSAPPEGDDAFTTEIEDVLGTVRFLD